MKEKYFWAIALIIMFGLGYGSWLQIKDYDFKKECLQIEREDPFTVYNPKLGGSFIQIPARVTYKCTDGRFYTRLD
jgi:hypothetical protein